MHLQVIQGEFAETLAKDSNLRKVGIMNISVWPAPRYARQNQTRC